jgi:hypothetical protein
MDNLKKYICAQSFPWCPKWSFLAAVLVILLMDFPGLQLAPDTVSCWAAQEGKEVSYDLGYLVANYPRILSRLYPSFCFWDK